jgi:hypothetical protein
MKEAFRDELGLSKSNIKKLAVINSIIEKYRQEGYRLTLRQLYYQLVTKDIIPNKQSEYAKLSALLVKGRMAGYVDWDAIEDRLRVANLPYWVRDIPDAINDTIRQYRLDRQTQQPVYIEVWCEKDALSSVLKRITHRYHVHLMVNRGYSSCSAMYDAYQRIARNGMGRKVVILYLGDHDPSGLDMVRDIKERLSEFGIDPEIRHVGITREQIKMYNPPPNPAKITDPRAKWYIEEHGNTSWEVDALDPKVLHALLIEHIEEMIDIDLFNEQIKKEEHDKEKLQEFADEFIDCGEE